jgi:hypothetical protein
MSSAVEAAVTSEAFVFCWLLTGCHWEMASKMILAELSRSNLRVSFRLRRNPWVSEIANFADAELQEVRNHLQAEGERSADRFLQSTWLRPAECADFVWERRAVTFRLRRCETQMT